MPPPVRAAHGKFERSLRNAQAERGRRIQIGEAPMDEAKGATESHH